MSQVRSKGTPENHKKPDENDLSNIKEKRENLKTDTSKKEADHTANDKKEPNSMATGLADNPKGSKGQSELKPLKCNESLVVNKPVSEKSHLDNKEKDQFGKSINLTSIQKETEQDANRSAFKKLNDKYLYQNYGANDKFIDTLEKLIEDESVQNQEVEEANDIFDMKGFATDPLYNVV